MLLPAHDYVKPRTLEEGLGVLSRSGAAVRLLGGGTDVTFNMRNRLMQPAVLLSIRELPELLGVEEWPDGSLRIGAACRLADLAAHQAVNSRHPALAAAFKAVASSHVRNMATLGGNLNLDTRCWYANQTQEWRAAKGGCLKTGVDACHVVASVKTCVAINNADTPPALIALDATITLASAGGRRTLRLADYYRADGVTHTVRRTDEVLTEVIVPPTPDRLVFIKDTARLGIDFAYGTIAARRAADGRTRLVLGSLGPAPVVLRRAAVIATQRGLADTHIEEAAEAAREDLGVVSNLHTPAAYKRDLARELVRRALTALRDMP